MIHIDPIDFLAPRAANLRELTSMQDSLNELVKPGWKTLLCREDFQTAMIAEFGGEILDSSTNVQWKHWKNTDPELFNSFNFKIEVTDSVFFYLSIMFYDSFFSPPDTYFDRYVGIDVTKEQEIGFIRDNQLMKQQYIRTFICLLTDSSVSGVDLLVSGAGMSSEEFSAFYVSKEILNRFRQSDGYQDGTYIKVSDGVEDNERLKPLIEAFIGDDTMTLNDLRQNVVNEFYTEAL